MIANLIFSYPCKKLVVSPVFLVHSTNYYSKYNIAVARDVRP